METKILKIWNKWKLCIEDLGLDASVLNAMDEYANSKKVKFDMQPEGLSEEITCNHNYVETLSEIDDHNTFQCLNCGKIQNRCECDKWHTTRECEEGRCDDCHKEIENAN